MRTNDPAKPAADLSAHGAEWFAAFQADGLHRLRVALVSAFGAETGVEAAAEATSYAWEHRDRLATMTNPAGYLFRVGQTAARRQRRWKRPPPPPAVSTTYEMRVDPDIPRALARLSARQRTAVVLVHVNGWTQEETAIAMGVDVSTVRTHLARGLDRLRRTLGGDLT